MLNLLKAYRKTLSQSEDKQHALVMMLLEKFVFALVVAIVLAVLNQQFWFQKHKSEKQSSVFENQMASSAQVLSTLSSLLMKMHALVELKCKFEKEEVCELAEHESAEKMDASKFKEEVEKIHPEIKGYLAALTKESVTLRVYMGDDVRAAYYELSKTLLVIDVTDGKAKDMYLSFQQLNKQGIALRNEIFIKLDELKEDIEGSCLLCN